jgi:hypothetical protein
MNFNANPLHQLGTQKSIQEEAPDHLSSDPLPSPDQEY